MRAAARRLLLPLLCAVPLLAAAQAFDPAQSHFGFELRTRWGQRVVGRFTRHAGELLALGDGRQQVRVRLDAAATEVSGSEVYSEMARGPRFFDAERHPSIVFQSEPFSPALAHDGGPLRGKLTLHGVTRRETFTLTPAVCARPGRECEVVASGTIDRAAYGLDSFSWALSNRVRFTMRVRLINEEG